MSSSEPTPDGTSPAPAGAIHDRLPPLKTRLTNLCLYILGCTNMLIIVPSSAQYAESMGAPASFSGLIVAAYSLSQLCMAWPYHYLMQALSLKCLMSSMAILSILANVLYACAGAMGSIYVVVIARMLLGISIFPAPYMYYITRAVGLRHRSRYMLQLSACMATGNVLGPLLAYVIDIVCEELQLESSLLNSSTLSGWLMALLFCLYLCALYFCFEEPGPEPELEVKDEAVSAEEGQAVAEKSASSPLLWAGMMVLLYLTVIVNTLGSSWEVFSVLLAERLWGWEDQYAALYLAATSALMIPVSLGGSDFLANKFSDRAIVLPCFVIAMSGAALFFNYGLFGSWSIILYSVGSLAFLTSMQLGRGFAQSLSSKIMPASHKAFFSTGWTMASRLGETVGPLLGSFFDQSPYAAFAVASLALGLMLIVASFPQLRAHERAT